MDLVSLEVWESAQVEVGLLEAGELFRIPHDEDNIYMTSDEVDSSGRVLSLLVGGAGVGTLVPFQKSRMTTPLKVVEPAKLAIMTTEDFEG